MWANSGSKVTGQETTVLCRQDMVVACTREVAVQRGIWWVVRELGGEGPLWRGP